MPPVERNEERVLILAPTERDVTLICDMLLSGDIPADACSGVEELTWKLKEGVGVGLLTDEALRSDGLERLFTELEGQPPWSDVPFLLLTDSGADLDVRSARFLERFGESANVTVLERPVRRSTFLSVVRSALRARRRQYELRDYLAERRKTEQELRQTQKLESIGVLAGGVAHDFNNLLVGILGNASLAQDMLPPGDPVSRVVEALVQASERAAHLTRQMLAYSGKGQFIIKPVNLSTLTRGVTKLVQSSISNRIFVHLDLARDLPFVEAD